MKLRINIYQDANTAITKLMGVNEALTASFDHKLRHIIDIRVSLMNECHFCINMHTKEALDGGDTQERVSALNHWQTSTLFDAREKAALAWAEALTRSASQDEIDALCTDLEPHFSKEDIALLTVAVAHINAWNRIGIASNRH
ncbi:MAG TPA: carboxymuconolactone decarboxylase family protein [Parvibaculum sp.]